MDKQKSAILFNGTAKEIEPHIEDLKKRYKTVEEAVEDLNSELNKQKRWISNCCSAPATEPGYPDSDVCDKCKEHAGFEVQND